MMPLLYGWAEAWLAFFSRMVWQNTWFLLAVFAVLHLLRRAPARLRYVVALVGLIKLMIPPFIELPSVAAGAGLVPTWQWPVVDLPLAVGIPGAGQAAVVLFVVWLAVLAMAFAWLWWSTWGLYALLRRSTPLQETALSTTQPVEVRLSASVCEPWSLRFRQGKIMVPQVWLHWPADCRRAVLEHELAHIERMDTWAQLLQTIVQAVYFFHPLVWLLNYKMYIYREMACDDRAIARSRLQPVQYATYLVDLGETMVQTVWPCSTATGWIWQSRRSLLHRVVYQIEEVSMKTLSKKVWITVAAGLLALVVLFSTQASSGAAAVRKTLLWQDEKESGAASQKEASFDQAPQVIKRINPSYPELARKAGIEGKVLVKMEIDKSGRVASTSCLKSEYRAKQDTSRVLKGEDKPQDPGLIEAALTAARGWEFKPAEKNGKPVRAEVAMEFNFKLQ